MVECAQPAQLRWLPPLKGRGRDAAGRPAAGTGSTRSAEVVGSSGERGTFMPPSVKERADGWMIPPFR